MPFFFFLPDSVKIELQCRISTNSTILHTGHVENRTPVKNNKSQSQ
ncbi:MAG: hypothetical protein LBE12_16560 [Planctomycetaceae bacterium]|nr:hypothetical protein [Planctomycetaceae bacterium]